jgi:hypothetical protein
MSGNGIGFGTLMFLIFLTLKLTNFIDWSWWWVTAPLWGQAAAIAIVFIFAFAISIVQAAKE